MTIKETQESKLEICGQKGLVLEVTLISGQKLLIDGENIVDIIITIPEKERLISNELH